MKTVFLVPLLSGCFGSGGLGYVMVGGAKPAAQAGGHMRAVNATSVPICEVDVSAVSMPDKTFANEEKAKIFLSPGEEKDVFSPALHDLMKPTTNEQLAKEENEPMHVVAYGCKKDAYDWDADASAALVEQKLKFDSKAKLVLR